MKGTLTHLTLAKHLKESGKTEWTYLVQGGEELLVDECRLLLRKHYPADERIVIQPEHGQKRAEDLAAQLSECIDHLSLFSETRHVEVLLEPSPTGKIDISAKLDSNAGNTLFEAAKRAENAKTRLVICISRADRALSKTSWFPKLRDACTPVSVPMIDKAALPGWIKDRLARSKRRLTGEAMNLLTEMTEGNLNAASQEVMKIEMLFPEGEIGAEDLRSGLVNLSRHNVFALRDALGSGTPEDVARLLKGLQREGTPEQLVVWALASEARALVALAERRDPGRGLWGRHRNVLEQAAAGENPSRFLRLLSKVQVADLKTRGLTGLAEDPWEDFLSAALLINRIIRRKAAA